MQDTFQALLGSPLSAQFLLSTVLGTLMPFLVAFVGRYVKSSAVKSGIIILASLVVGLLVCWALGLLDWKNITFSLLLIWYASQLAYQKFWKRSTITDMIESGGGLLNSQLLKQTINTVRGPAVVAAMEAELAVPESAPQSTPDPAPESAPIMVPLVEPLVGDAKP